MPRLSRSSRFDPRKGRARNQTKRKTIKVGSSAGNGDPAISPQRAQKMRINAARAAEAAEKEKAEEQDPANNPAEVSDPAPPASEAVPELDSSPSESDDAEPEKEASPEAEG